MEKIMITKIKSVLTPDLLKPEYREKNKTNPMYGHCYAASEAAYHLFAKADGFFPVRDRDSRGVCHWWLENPQGERLDITGDQYFSVGRVPPYFYRAGKRVLTKEPSKRAAEIIRRVRA